MVRIYKSYFKTIFLYPISISDEKNAQDKISSLFHATNFAAPPETAIEAKESEITNKDEDFGAVKSNDNDATFDTYFEQLISNIRLEEPTDDNANDSQMLMIKDEENLMNSVSSSSSSNSCCSNSSSSSENSNISFSGGDQQPQTENNLEMSNNESSLPVKKETIMSILEGGDVIIRNQKVEVVGSTPDTITLCKVVGKDKDSQQNTTENYEEVATATPTAACLENNNFKSIIVETDNFVEK